MRQQMSEKNVRKIREQTGLPVVCVKVRGNTDHRKDLFLENGDIVCLEKDGEIRNYPLKWK